MKKDRGIQECFPPIHESFVGFISRPISHPSSRRIPSICFISPSVPLPPTLTPHGLRSHDLSGASRPARRVARKLLGDGGSALGAAHAGAADGGGLLEDAERLDARRGVDAEAEREVGGGGGGAGRGRFGCDGYGRDGRVAGWDLGAGFARCFGDEGEGDGLRERGREAGGQG